MPHPVLALLATKFNATAATVLEIHAEAVEKLLLGEIKQCLAKTIKSYERIHAVLVMPQAFSLDNNMVLPLSS